MTSFAQSKGLNPAQIWGRAQLRARREEAAGLKWTDGGTFPVPVFHVELLLGPGVPAPLLRLFIRSCQRADAEGRFRASARELAGREDGKRSQHAERGLDRLAEAGLITQESRGDQDAGPSSYRILPMVGVEVIEAARASLQHPLTSK